MNFVNIEFENQFESLEAAMAACLLIGTCHKVQDPGCDRNPKTGGFQLCLRKPLAEASLISCVYEKTDNASLGAICLKKVLRDYDSFKFQYTKYLSLRQSLIIETCCPDFKTCNADLVNCKPNINECYSDKNIHGNCTKMCKLCPRKLM